GRRHHARRNRGRRRGGNDRHPPQRPRRLESSFEVGVRRRNPEVTLAGIILAAGASSRMGADKALLPYAGTTFLEHLVELLLPRVAPVIVVLGHHAERIRAVLPAALGAEIVLNPDYRSGQLSSLQAGIRALPGGAEAALIILVDHPAIAPSTL